ncbi:MAG: hypothetical protein ACRCWG_04860 [Sarcina sp.]
MGLEFNVKNINILDDLEAELSKKLKLKISFDDLDDLDDETNETNETNENE